METPPKDEMVIMTVRGMSKQQAKDAVEHIYGSLMWGREEDGAIRAYPIAGDLPIEIVE